MVQLGVWDVMDTGNYNNESHTPPAYSAFERFTVGWLDFVELDTPADLVTLDELTQNNVAYKISTADENEFFTLENRQQKGWDAYLPGRGLMISMLHTTSLHGTATMSTAEQYSDMTLLKRTEHRVSQRKATSTPLPQITCLQTTHHQVRCHGMERQLKRSN